MADTLDARVDELSGRMAALERRLGAIERALGAPPPPPPVAAPLPAPPPPPVGRAWVESYRSRPADAADATDEIPVAVAVPAGAASSYGAPVPPPPMLYAEVIDDAAGVGSAPVPPPIPAGYGYARAAAARAGGSGDRAATARDALEATIGRNWTSWVGGIVVVLGAFFFLQYAWDQGWLRLSPAARVGAAIAAGVAMGGLGEWAYRRRMGVLAAALGGAGVAIVMAAFFAAHTMFAEPVLSATVAMAGVCATAAIAIWRAARTDAVGLAILALLGAYLAPAILRSGRDESAALMAYLAALAVVGWALCFLRPRWGALRWFLLACTAAWVGAFVVWYPARGEHRPLAIAAVSFFLAGFLGEAVLTLHKVLGRAPRVDGAPHGQAERLRGAGALENVLASVSMLATAGAFGAFYAVLPPAGAGDGLFHAEALAGIAVGLASVHGMLALATPSRQFARSSLLQAAALVTVAVPLTFGRVAVTLAWLAMAVAMAALAWRRRNPAVRVWAVVLLGLALARLFTFDFADSALRGAWWTGEGGEVSPWLLLAWATAVAWHAVGWVLLPWSSAKNAGKDPAAEAASPLSATLAGVGSAVFFIAASVCLGGTALTFAWAAWVGATVALAGRGARLAYAENAAVALLVAAGKWLALDALRPVIEAWARGGGAPPVVNAAALAGVVLIALAAWLGRRLGSEGRPVAKVGAAALAFVWLNVEAMRAVDAMAGSFADLATAKQVALSVLWAVAGLAGVVVGFARAVRPLRYAALTLLGVTLVKVLFLDLAQVRPVYRILSFLVVGGLLLCVSFVYHRQGEGQGRR